MKKILLFIGLLISVIQAESLSIINDIDTSKVYLNGVMIGQGAISNFEVEPGEYQIQIKVDNEVVYTKAISIYTGENRVINANRFVNVTESKVANVGVRKVEEERLRKAVKGNIAVGGKFGGYVSGLSLKWFPVNRFGTQLTLWASNENKASHSAYQGRVLYEIDNKLALTDTLFTLYVGVGFGQVSDAIDESQLETVITSDRQKETISMYEALIGVEFPVFTPISFGFIEAGYSRADISQTAFGGQVTDQARQSVSIMAGCHIYFD